MIHPFRSLALAGAAAALVACAAPVVPPGASRDAVLQTWGPPTGRYALPDGAERLEYASGPFGRTTWMIDVDPAGRVRAVEQVLNETKFADLQARAPGMSRDALLREIGRPGERRHGGRMGGELWSYRYPTNDCLRFLVALGDDTRVVSASYGIDWACDAMSDRD